MCTLVKFTIQADSIKINVALELFDKSWGVPELERERVGKVGKLGRWGESYEAVERAGKVGELERSGSWEVGKLESYEVREFFNPLFPTSRNKRHNLTMSTILPFLPFTIFTIYHFFLFQFW